MKTLWIRLQQLLTLALGFYPALPVLFLMKQPSTGALLLLYPGAFLVLALPAMKLPGKWRLLWGLAGAAAMALWPLGVESGFTLPVILGNVLWCGILLASLPLAAWPRQRELPVPLRIVMLVLQLIGQLALLSDRLDPHPVLGEYRGTMALAFGGFVLLMALALNRESMEHASGENRPVTPGMRRKNAWMTLGLVALAALASFIPKIYGWLRDLVFLLIGLVLWLVGLLAPDTSGEGGAASGGAPEGFGPMEPGEPSLLARILEVVALVLCAVILLLVVVWLLKKLWQGLKLLFGKLLRFLGAYAAAVGEDYQDEVTDTRADTPAQAARRDRRRRGTLQREPREPREAVRYRYGRLLRRHRWRSSTTARENIPPELAGLYEKARYSPHPVTQEDAARFRKETREL